MCPNVATEPICLYEIGFWTRIILTDMSIDHESESNMELKVYPMCCYKISLKINLLYT